MGSDFFLMRFFAASLGNRQRIIIVEVGILSSGIIKLTWPLTHILRVRKGLRGISDRRRRDHRNEQQKPTARLRMPLRTKCAQNDA